MIVLFYISVTVLINIVASIDPPIPTDTYLNRMVLVEPNVYILYWNFTDNDILFETHVQNGNGWSGFGLSPNGGMINSDVIITWSYSNGSTHFTDRYITPEKTVLVDKIQNWFLLSSTKLNNYSITKFTRKIKICDNTNQDMDILSGTPFIIFAWSTTNPTNDITYHSSNRGSTVVPLISSLNLKVNLNTTQLETIEYRVNASLDTVETEYFCQVFKLPSNWTALKRHLVRYETLFTKGNENIVHHWTMNECSNEVETVYKNQSFPLPGSCLSSNQSDPWYKFRSYCKIISLVWAVGGPLIQDFPENLAYPFGGSETEAKYFFLEIHYDNPSLRANIQDYSGIKLYVTTNYRPIEFGILTVGAIPDWNSMVIPPQTNKFSADYYCRKECLNTLFDNNTAQINVFSTMPHTHLKGKELYTTLIRNGEEIAYLANNKYYDFNYQYYNFLSKPISIQQNDEIKTQCIYSTAGTDSFVYGGHSSREEMCMDFIWYYPKSNGASLCLESFNEADYYSLWSSMNSTGEISINLTPEFYLKPINFTSKSADKFQNFFNNTRFGSCINNMNEKVTYNNMTQVRLIQSTCTVNNDTNIYLPAILITSTKTTTSFNKASKLSESFILIGLFFAFIF